MKKIIYLLIVLVLVSCTDQLTVEEVTEKATAQIPESNVDRLIEQESRSNIGGCCHRYSSNGSREL